MTVASDVDCQGDSGDHSIGDLCGSGRRIYGGIADLERENVTKRDHFKKVYLTHIPDTGELKQIGCNTA